MARNVLLTSCQLPGQPPGRSPGQALGRALKLGAAGVLGLLQLLVARAAFAEPPEKHVSEATLVLPDLASVQFLGMDGKTLLLSGLGVCALAMVFGLVIGVVCALARSYGNAAASWAAAGYVEFIRNVPLILLVYWSFYVLPMIVDIQLNPATERWEALRDGVLAGHCHEVNYASFLYWKRNRAGTAEHVFAHPALVSRDNALIAIRMGPRTANPGAVYFAAGSFEAMFEEPEPEAQQPAGRAEIVVRRGGEQMYKRRIAMDQRQNVTLEGVPDIITRGFVMENSQELLADGARVLAEVIEQASLEERSNSRSCGTLCARSIMSEIGRLRRK